MFQNEGCIGIVPFFHHDLVSPRSSCPYGKPGDSPWRSQKFYFYEKCSAEASHVLRTLTSLSRHGLDSHIGQPRIRQPAS